MKERGDWEDNHTVHIYSFLGHTVILYKRKERSEKIITWCAEGGNYSTSGEARLTEWRSKSAAGMCPWLWLTRFRSFFNFFSLSARELVWGGDLNFFRKLKIVLVILFCCIFALDGKEDNRGQYNLDLITFSCIHWHFFTFPWTKEEHMHRWCWRKL